MSYRHFRSTPRQTLRAALTVVIALLAPPLLGQKAIAAPTAVAPAIAVQRPDVLAPAAGAARSLRASESLAAVPDARVSRTATPLVKLGLGDTISLSVFGKPDLGTKTVVADDGTVQLPLIGSIRVVGLSPSEAAQVVTQAYVAGEFLVNPQVTITLDNGTSQQVSVLGEVGTPGRYPVESRTSVFDLLATAGGKTEDSADVLYLVRTEADGKVSRMPIDLSSLADPSKEFPSIKFQGGDTIYVPRAPQVFIYGEISKPGEYRLQPGMSLIEALTIAGGVTRRGSMSRIEIKRKKPDGKFMTVYPKLNDTLLADDVIRVKESIF